MNKNAILRIFSIITLLASFVIFFSLFAKVRNVTLLYKIDTEQKLIYFLLALGLIFSITLFVLSLLNATIKDSEEKYNRKAYDIDINKKRLETNENQFNDDKFDVEYYINKIIPKENSKLDLAKYTEKILSNIAKEFDIVQGLFFVKAKDSDIFNITGKYAYFGDQEPKSFKLGETMSGQVAKNKTILNLKEIPENYITILSGLGSSSPNHLIIVPIVVNDNAIAIIELASFKEFKRNFNDLFEAMSEKIGSAVLKY